MRIAIGLLGATLLLAGCAHHHAPPQAGPGQSPQTVIRPDFRASGQVVMVNAAARFVVISFPPGPVPQTGHALYIYRNGFKVGEVKVSGPQHENDTVADIIAGDAQLHDEAREE
jgi:hypothetical protein